METYSQVAGFVRARIAVVGTIRPSKAKDLGLDSPDMLVQIKNGKARIPFEKVGAVANAIKADPFELWTMCMKEYQPDTWKAVSPFMDVGLTADERRLINNLRFAAGGGPYLAALTDESKRLFNELIDSLQCHKTIQ